MRSKKKERKELGDDTCAYVGLAVGSDRYRCIVINVGEDGEEGQREGGGREKREAYACARRFIGYEDL